MSGSHGRVVALTARRALIEVKPGFHCSRCAAGRGCGAALLAGSRHRKAILLPVPRRPDLRLDQAVSLSLPVATMARMGARAYGVGLGGILLGLGAGAVMGLGDAAAAGIGLLGLLAGLALGRTLSRGDQQTGVAGPGCVAAPAIPNQAQLQ